MKLLILRTNIKTRSRVNRIVPVFNSHPAINTWSIDTEDIDNVLRIEAKESVKEHDIIQLVKTQGFSCEELEDY